MLRGELMKNVFSVLEKKLSLLGYNSNIINSVLKKFDLALIERNIENLDKDEVEKIVDIVELEEPNVDIIELFLNIGYDVLKLEVLEGDIAISSTSTAIGTRFAIANYTLSKRNVLMALLSDYTIKILVYKPNPKTQSIYNGITYEEIYKKERDEITKEYYDAFVRNGKVSEKKIRDILTLLASDYVIDELAVTGANPRIKMYDDEQKYAKNLYSYSLRYINVKNNRIEVMNKDADVKRTSKNVTLGMINNDPYIKLDNLPHSANFPLNTFSYCWLNSNQYGQEEISIFVPSKVYNYAMYADMLKNSVEIEKIAGDIIRKLNRESNENLDVEYVKSVLQKLNPELVNPSVDIIHENLNNKVDAIEPIKYRYQVITEPADFEEKLYVTIEDNVSRRYKYKLVENILEDLTTIGSKLEYTDENGELVIKQSIADFNVNAPTAVIRRETFIDINKIPTLLGYIYEDMKYYGTEALPVPSIEVDFYMPQDGGNSNTVMMYNGTSLDFALNNISKQNLFNEAGMIHENAAYIIGGNALPGSTYVKVKYLNSRGEILKENNLGNLFPKTTFLPDIIPLIKDKEGKEWVLEGKEIVPFVVKENPENNVIELKYVEKYAHVNVSFINREGKNIAREKDEIVQVGTTYDFSDKKLFKDSNGDEWKLISARPQKFIVSAVKEKNKIILVYDIEKADVIINYLDKKSNKIAEPKIIQAPVDKKYTAEKIPFIKDEQGLGWKYIETSNPTVVVKKEEENVINLTYEEAKEKVVIRYRNNEGLAVADDKVEFVQVGKKYIPEVDEDITDFQCQEWKLDSITPVELIIAEKVENIIEVKYQPVLANVSVRYVDFNNSPIKNAEIEKVQVGKNYEPGRKIEIVDNYGKTWRYKEKSSTLIVSKREIENSITLKYEPLISQVTIKYYDIEMNEILSPKVESFQVGTKYRPEPLEKVIDSDGRHWIINKDNIPAVVVKKHETENVIPIYYDKRTTKVQLKFYDIFNNELRMPQEVDSQIGAQFERELYLGIVDDKGGKWSLESSEPKNLIVKEANNVFKLIYGEMKAKVLVKHIDVRSQKAVVEDIVTTIKLGGIYVPDIRKKVLDKNKYQWKYIGDENISIIVKENEQENIIILDYEEDTSKVILQYQNESGEKVREDAVKEVQIGKQIKVEAIPKIMDNNGLGWKYISSSVDSKIVEKEGNVVINYYEPLMAIVSQEFINEDGKNIVENKDEKIQVGKKYVPTKIEKLYDSQGCAWIFDSTSVDEIIVADDINKISNKFKKLLLDVTINFKDMDGNLIAEPIVEKRHVGTVYKVELIQNYVDKQDRAWILDNVDYEQIKVTEQTEKNIINVSYKKELVEVTLRFFGDNFVEIAKPQIVKEQIGSMYLPSPNKEIVDNKMLGWRIDEEKIHEFKVQRKVSDNIISLPYVPHLVNVSVEFLETNGNKIIEDNVTKHQIGTKFLPEISDYITDNEDREWINVQKAENKFFSTMKKTEPIVVSKDEEKNKIILYYKPSKTKVTIRFVDPLGAVIKPDEQLEAQIGSIYEAKCDEKLVGIGKVKWVYNPNSKKSIKVGKDPEKNVINLAYEEEKALVIYKYLNEYKEEIKKPKKVLAQIGSIYKAEPENIIEDNEQKVWEYKAKNIGELKVEDDESKNIIEVIYVPLKVDVIIKILNFKGEKIIPNKVVKAQLGSEFTPTMDDTITDEESKLFKLVKYEPASIKVKEVPIASNEEINIFEAKYESVFGEARICFKDVDGNKLRDDEVKQLQVGVIFEPQPIQYVKDKNGIQWQLISEKIDSLRVKEDSSENVISMVYEIAKAEITVKYKDVDGNIIRKSDIYHMEIGKEFVPTIEDEIVDEQNKKWIYSVAEPLKLTVGSINNIINLIYQEKKALVTVIQQTTGGKKLKEDLKIKVQIGSRYVPKVTSKVIYDENNLWRYAYNSPSEIIVSENQNENIIVQYYTDDSSVKDDPNKPYTNPDVAKFIDQELVQEVEKEEAEKRAAEEVKRQEKEKEKLEEVVFTEENLKRLEKNIKLTNDEKRTIKALDDCNSKIISTLHEALNYQGNLDEFKLQDKLEEISREEKKLAQEGLNTLISDDRTGNKVLQIFEAITSSKINDSEFALLQQKKAILLADYFINKNIADIEQATYIIERGKVEKGLECINQKIAVENNKKHDLVKVKIILIYELVMLNNYYKSRSTIKDSYFNDAEAKEKLSTELIVLVTNILPNHVMKLMNKIDTLTDYQRNELDALMKLLTQQQLNTVGELINKIDGGKQRRMAQKMYKEITGKK